MKRIALICWLLLGLAPMIPAANTTWGPAEIDVEITTGTLSVEWTGFERGNHIMSPLRLWKIDWASNPDGDVTFETDQIQGRLVWLVTNPDDGATSPSDNYDITILSNGIDLLGGAGLNRDQANNEFLYVFGPGSGNVGHPLLIGDIEFNIENAGDETGGVILLGLEEE